MWHNKFIRRYVDMHVGKTERLLNKHGNICSTPGMPDSFCVASEGGGKPHIVTRNKKGVVVCDKACLGWKSQNICSPVLATAEKMGNYSSL